MGNTIDPTYRKQDKIFKICLKCNKSGKRNSDIELLNLEGDFDEDVTFYLRCSKGHLFCYTSQNTSHSDYVYEYFESLKDDCTNSPILVSASLVEKATAPEENA